MSVLRRRVGRTRWQVLGEDEGLLRDIGEHDWERWREEPEATHVLTKDGRRACYGFRSRTTGRRYFVKVLRYTRLKHRLRYRVRRCPAAKEWLQGREAIARGMRMPGYVALGERFRLGFKCEAYCVSRFEERMVHPDEAFDDPALSATLGGRDRLLCAFTQAFGAGVRRLHDSALYHREMKPSNLYCVFPKGDPAVEVGFLDAKHITVLRRPSEEHRFRNLLRTLEMWGPHFARLGLGTRDVLRFLHAYEPDRNAHKTLIADLRARMSTGPFDRSRALGGWAPVASVARSSETDPIPLRR